MFVVADLAAARLLLWLRPDVELSVSERLRLARLRQESAERRYRIESLIYDHDLAKNFEGDAWWGPLRYHVTTDSLGFRDASARSVPLANARRRVLLLGDSFTEGLGLDYADTYAGLIAARLGRNGVEVLNAGVTSYSPAIYYAKSRYLLEDAGLQVTDVVVFIDISDAEDEARYYDLHRDGHVTRMVNQHPGVGPEFDGPDERADHLDPPASLSADGRRTRRIETPAPIDEVREVSPAMAAWRRRSILVRAIDALEERRVHGSAPAGYPQGNPRRPLWTIDERDYEAFGRAGLELGARHMDRLVSLLRRHGATLTIAVYPWPDQLRYDSADSVQVRYWRRWAGRRGARFVDLFAPLFGESDHESAIRRNYISGDVHFNRNGARLVADGFLAQWQINRP